MRIMRLKFRSKIYLADNAVAITVIAVLLKAKPK